MLEKISKISDKIVKNQTSKWWQTIPALDEKRNMLPQVRAK